MCEGTRRMSGWTSELGLSVSGLNDPVCRVPLSSTVTTLSSWTVASCPQIGLHGRRVDCGRVTPYLTPSCFAGIRDRLLAVLRWPT